MSHKITQKDVNNIVWKACDTFRGIIDPSQYKDYILTMLFLKYVTDVYNEKKAEYEEKYAGNQERVQRALERERFVVPQVSSFDYLYENRNSPKIGEMINHALAELEELKSIFLKILEPSCPPNFSRLASSSSAKA